MSKQINKIFNNGRTNYKNGTKKVQEHILTLEESQAMIAKFLKTDTIKVYDNRGKVIEELKQW